MHIMILSECISGLGLGHVARCLNLALKFIQIGYEITLFIRGDGDFKKFILAQNIDKHILEKLHILSLQWEDITNTRMLTCDICIIDTYHVTNLDKFIQHASVVLLFDDDKRYINLAQTNTHIFLLNQNGCYKDMQISQCIKDRIFLGIEYALINKAFDIEPSAQKIYDYFVCLGGEDPLDKSYEIFTNLCTMNAKAAIIIGANYKGRLLDSNNNNIDIYKNISQQHIATLISQSNACIVSGGGIIFEALKLCANVFALNLASNQDLQISALQSCALIKEISLPLDSTILKHNTNHCAHNVGSKCNDMLDKLLLESLNINIADSKKHKDYHIDNMLARNFCNLDMDSIMRILSYRNHEFVRKHMYGNNIIDLQSHLTFIQSLHNEDSSRYFLIQDLKSPNLQDLGVISLTRINIKHRNAYLGIYKNPLLHISCGKQLLSAIEYIAFKEYALHMLYLEVKHDNISAIKLYESSGFTHIGILKEAFKDDTYADILIYAKRNNYL